MKRTIIIGILGGFLLSSCSVTQKSYKTTRIDAQVKQYPTVADLVVKPKVERTVSWNYLFFNYGKSNLSIRKSNLIADLLKEQEADILLEPQATYIKKSFGKRILEIQGYPAVLQNIRKADYADLEQLADTASPAEQHIYNLAESNKENRSGSTQSVDKRKTRFIIRAGYASSKFVNGDFDLNRKAGYSVGIELNTLINENLYWNTGVLFSNRGAKYEIEYFSEEFMNHSLQVPLGMGYLFPLSQSLKLDIHLAPYVSFDFKQDDILVEEIKKWDAGIMYGVGLWFKKYNFDVSMQRGFLDPGNNLGKASNIMLRLGILF